MKKLISASWKGRNLENIKLCKALLQYQNMPCGRDAKLPAQKLFGAGRLLERNRMFLRRHHSMSAFPGSRNTETDPTNRNLSLFAKNAEGVNDL